MNQAGNQHHKEHLQQAGLFGSLFQFPVHGKTWGNSWLHFPTLFCPTEGFFFAPTWPWKGQVLKSQHFLWWSPQKKPGCSTVGLAGVSVPSLTCKDSPHRECKLVQQKVFPTASSSKFHSNQGSPKWFFGVPWQFWSTPLKVVKMVGLPTKDVEDFAQALPNCSARQNFAGYSIAFPGDCSGWRRDLWWYGGGQYPTFATPHFWDWGWGNNFPFWTFGRFCGPVSQHFLPKGTSVHQQPIYRVVAGSATLQLGDVTENPCPAQPEMLKWGPQGQFVWRWSQKIAMWVRLCPHWKLSLHFQLEWEPLGFWEWQTQVHIFSKWLRWWHHCQWWHLGEYHWQTPQWKDFSLVKHEWHQISSFWTNLMMHLAMMKLVG